jgi:hypothetical protein
VATRGIKAEGKGLEPSTGKPAPDFESTPATSQPESKQRVTAASLKGAAVGAAAESETAAIDPDLQAVIDAWPTLARPFKKAILALAE